MEQLPEGGYLVYLAKQFCQFRGIGTVGVLVFMFAKGLI